MKLEPTLLNQYYYFITHQVINQKMMISVAAKKLKLKYHSAKSIVRVYRKENRLCKIQKKADKSKYLLERSKVGMKEVKEDVINLFKYLGSKSGCKHECTNL